MPGMDLDVRFMFRQDALCIPVSAGTDESASNTPDGRSHTPGATLQLVLRNASTSATTLYALGNLSDLSVFEIQKAQGFEHLPSDSLLLKACDNKIATNNSMKFDIFTETEQPMPQSRDETPVFRWSKEKSIYGRLKGAWRLSLIETIQDGVRNAGTDFKVLLRFVNGQQLEQLRKAWEDGEHVVVF